MKHTGIHILDFNDKIIDYISRDDGALLNAVMSTNAEEKSETFDFTMLNDRAEHLRERNRIIAQDNNGVYREFIISHVVDNFDGTTDVESNASYLEDIDKSRPIKPGKYSSYSTSQALNETLRNTGWEMSDDTEHGGMRTTSWTSYSTPYEVINMLCTTYGMVAEYYIELGSHTVEHRYVTLKKPVSLFKGKEITKGKDLTGMTRTVDMSEVRTALYAIGPENDTGQRLEKIVTDDDAQAQFGLPGRYLWSVYEPESDDSNMTDERLTTLAKTELNKRNKSAISYEITSTDIHRHYPEMVVSLHDTVRIKDRDFRPPLYIEAEVIGVDYNLLTDESNYKFGNVVEYEENNLRDIFNKKLADISKKLNDNVSNVNTIVKDAVAGQLEYFERKIFKQDTPPENPVNDMLWYDTSNPNVAVLRRYWNGEWLNETVDDVEKIGGVTREKALYDSIKNAFENLSIQHAKLMDETYAVLNSEYLVDTDLKTKLQTELNNVDGIYQKINSDLGSITSDTATIGTLIDIQSQFSSYRQKLQNLYKAMRNAQISADKRLKLLQSQYTDEKFNEAMNKVASKFGLTVDNNNNMVGTPNVIEKAIQVSREDTAQQLKSYVKSVDYQTDKNGIVERLDSADSERKQLNNLISDKVSLSEYKNMTIGTRNLIANSEFLAGLTYWRNVGATTPANSYDTTLTDMPNGFKNVAIYESNDASKEKGIAQDNLSLEIGKEYVLSAWVKILNGAPTFRLQAGKTKWINQNFEGNNTWQRYEFVFTAYESPMNIYILKPNNIVDSKVAITGVQLVQGNKNTDWKASDKDTDTKLTNMTTSITQNGQDIQQRATKEEFNASKKALSKTISDFTNNVATGMTFTYDENGAIQLMNIGSDGIKLKGDKVDITVNKDFNVVTQNLNNKVGKDEVINRINLSNEGLDINVNKLGIVGGDSTNSLTIRNNQVLSRGKYSRTWSGVTDTPNATVGIRNGYIMSSNEDTGYNLYMTEKGLSTMMSGGLGSEQAGALEFHYDLMNDRSRGVRLSSTYGVVFLQSEQSRIYTRSRFTTNIETWEGSIYLRPWTGGRVGANEFSFYIKQNDTPQFTDGVLLFGEISNETNIPGYGNAGSGIRFRKAGMPTETYGDYEPIVYATNNQGDIGSGSFYANRLYGDWTSKADNLYANVKDKLRITDIKGYNNGSPNYKDLQCRDIQSNSIRLNDTDGKDFYIGVSTNELRVTNNLFWNGGNVGYRDIHCKDVISEGTVYYTNGFAKKSSEQYKENIKKWSFNATESIKNTELYQFNYINDESKTLQHGVVIERETPQHFISDQGDSVNSDEILYTTMKALKEQIIRNDALERRIEKLEEQINGK
ncbi:phage tail spike protein [Staphylococcus warneri]|uniref:phage tail spike protein n=1 Tax=Staphylococcus warneri TaxID=1292 RepID=UPI00079471EA|nr:phage tail spike protein [Staphylococcus warneri]KTW21555.1 phage minor structural protein, N-terminal domain protein [Staphylococcus warneri]MDK8170100.1 phage tail spike protein [Staphylococcus warneri]DAZ21410.1 MAG TPA: minor structural protein [Caudoviricetes sp.]